MSLTADTQKSDQTATPAGDVAVLEPQVAVRDGADQPEEKSPTPMLKPRKSVGEAWQHLKDSTKDLFATARFNAISAMPRQFVNNSSNILGAAHVGTEIMMFKASLPKSVLVDNPKGPIDYVVRAVKRVFSESFSGSKTDIAELKAAVKGKPISGFIHHIRDVDGATERAIYSKVGKIDSEGKLITRANLSLGNPWQTRSTLAGLVVWSLSAIIPDQKESSEEVERMAVLRETNPMQYVGERFKQALWVPEWGAHKRQMIGLGIMTSGICSLLGSWRNNIQMPQGKVYAFNGGYFCTSALTFISSLPLLFASDDQKGFGAFGAWMTGRLAFLPSSIARKFKGDKMAATYYTASMAGFQAENWTQALIGGAEKLPDGTIVDHEDIKKKAHQEAKEIKLARRNKHNAGFDSVVPSNQVTLVSGVERAMPELAQLAEQKQAATTTV
jgi:hypothetical protein